MRHLLIAFCLWSMMALVPSWAQDRPVPQFKPYPNTKSSERDASASTSSSASNSTHSSSPNSWETRDHSSDNAKPFGVAPVESLKAHPPTSGKEPMLLLDKKNKPITQAIHESDRLTFFDCKGLLAPWFQELVTAEMNYFSELVEFPLINGSQCVVTMGTPKSLTPGRLSVQMYLTSKDLNNCMMDSACFVFRSVNLIPKNGGVYRSYFLSDMFRKVVAQQCVTPKGKLYSNTTCYSVD